MSNYTLNELVTKYDSSAVVLADAGNGSSIGEMGVVMFYDNEMYTNHGDTEMHVLPEVHRSDDGFDCHYASDWIEVGTGPNPYRIRIYF